MTILPKKKHQETRKNEQDHDIDNRSRNRNRSREARAGRTLHPSQDELLGNVEASPNSSLSQPVYNDIEIRESQDGTTLPHKRSRHNRQSSNFYHSSPGSSNSVHNIRNSKSREGSESPTGNNDINEDGYNSSDEHGPSTHDQAKALPSDDNVNVIERENEFERQLCEKKGFIIKQMATDGACMFRAVADQVYGDQEMHSVVRRHCMDYMVKNRDFFSPYITEDFGSYVRRKRNEHSHGNHIEMQALSEMYNRPIEVYQYSCEPINTFHSRSGNMDDTPPIRLSYHGNVHYNSIIDPYNPTVGVGLGLAGYKPGTEDDRLKSASKESEALLLEQAMLEDKIKATDWEATDEHLAEIAARESYLQWLKDHRKPATTSSEASSSKSTSTKSRRSPPREHNHNNRRSPPHDVQSSRRSPPKDLRRTPPHSDSSDRHNQGSSISSKASCSSSQQTDTSTDRLSGSSVTLQQPKACATNDWSYALGFDSEWDNDPVLAAVLAQSQQEYLDSITKSNNSNTSKSTDTGGSCSKS